MSVAALEARARGTHNVLSPVLDLARDPRWGRTEETYGEDPYLVARLGVAAIRGYQGTSRTLAKDKVLATAKHFAGHGPHEGGINTAPTAFAERAAARRVPLPVRGRDRARRRSMAVMPSYNEMDGVPSHKNRWLLDRVLRQEWGFDGMVVSDYYAIDQMVSRHGVAADLADAARQALEAGVDVELPDIAAYPTLARPREVGPRSRRPSSIAPSRASCGRSSWPGSSRTRTSIPTARSRSATRPSTRPWRWRRRGAPSSS